MFETALMMQTIANDGLENDDLNGLVRMNKMRLSCRRVRGGISSAIFNGCCDSSIRSFKSSRER